MPLLPKIVKAAYELLKLVGTSLETNKLKFVSELLLPPLAIIPAPCLVSESGNTLNNIPIEAVVEYCGFVKRIRLPDVLSISARFANPAVAFVTT